MNTEPLVSVIVCVRNGERFIESSLQSVLSSTYKNIELIVIDGHSQDATVERVKSFGSAITLFPAWTWYRQRLEPGNRCGTGRFHRSSQQ